MRTSPSNGLHIKKIDSKTQAPLEGAKFRVSEKGGRLIGEYATDNQGESVIDDLQPGWYTIEETKAPNGYRLDNTPKDVEFVWGQFVTVEFTNELLSPIQIRKIDSETGAPLAGAKFRITKANGEYVGDFSTSTDGFLNVPELEPGFYIVSETKAPEGYLLDNTPQTIEVKANVPTIDEVYTRGYRELRIAEDGALYVLEQQEQVGQGRLSYLPGKKLWADLVPLFEEDDITATVEEDSILLTWAN